MAGISKEGKADAVAAGRKRLSKRRLLRWAKELAKEARTLLKRKGHKIEAAARDTVADSHERVLSTLPSRREGRALNHDALTDAAIALDKDLTQHLGHFRKSMVRELIEAIAWAVGLALIIRFFLIEAFSIPSGSMIPTLQIGDHLFINKIGYGIYWPLSTHRAISWDQPDPGDIIVFQHHYPGDNYHGKDYIKRVIAVPGDRVRLVDNVVHINDAPIPTRVIGTTTCGISYEDNADAPARFCACVRQEETRGDATYITQHFVDPSCPSQTNWPARDKPRQKYFGAAVDNEEWPNVLIPEGHVLVMGDNRDSSEDSRYWGLVPYERIKGTAFLIWWARDKSRLFTWIN